jgi:hypothetical protein
MVALPFITIGTLAKVFAQNDWQVGQLVGLQQGTCIREGPGFGYQAHTVVPENNWTVMVIDGPRTADGRIWWDTSRNAAGDPSGGTGWVTQDQDDRDCAKRSPSNPQPGNEAPPIVIEMPSIPDTRTTWDRFTDWWFQQPSAVQWTVAIIALTLFSILWRVTGRAILELVGACISAFILWFGLSVTRQYWYEVWVVLAQPIFHDSIPDLAFLLGMLPIASWFLSYIGRVMRQRT